MSMYVDSDTENMPNLEDIIFKNIFEPSELIKIKAPEITVKSVNHYPEKGKSVTVMSNGEIITGDSILLSDGKWNGRVRITDPKNPDMLYVGEVVNNYRCGYGVHRDEKCVLKSKFSFNQPYGPATLTFSDGERKIGNLVEGKFCGPVIKTSTRLVSKKDKKGNVKVTRVIDKLLFKGTMWNNKAHGYCKTPNREGTFMKGYLDGYGKKVFKNGNVYEGFFRKNKRHGLGKLTSKDGSVIYEGEFRNNKRRRVSTPITTNRD